MNKRQWENLVRAGAFDRLNQNRARLHAAVDLLVRHGSAEAQERSAGQSNLFSGVDVTSINAISLRVSGFESDTSFDFIGASNLNPVPLPASGVLLAAVFAGAAIRARRKRL